LVRLAAPVISVTSRGRTANAAATAASAAAVAWPPTAGAHPDDQGPVVLAADARMAGTGPDPDGDPHGP
jgi:hypothetical protein